MPRLSLWSVIAVVLGSCLGLLVPAFGADQKPLVINPTTGKQEQLQAGNRLQIPTAAGGFFDTIDPGVQTATRVVSLPVMTVDGVFGVFTATPTSGRVAITTTNGQQTTSGQLLYTGGNLTLGSGAASEADYFIMNGGASGSAAGAAILLRNNGGNIFQLGNKSSILGGAYDATCYLQPTGALNIAGQVLTTDTTDSTSVSTGAQVVSGGQGVAKRSFLGTIGATFKGNVLAGVQDATAAVAGQVGEEIKSTVSAVAVAGTGTVGNVTSISLTAGDWQVSGYFTVAGGATGLTLGSTVNASIVTVTATNGTLGDTMQQQTVYALVANGLQSMAIPAKRVNISATTTYYLTEQVTFAGGSPTASGTLTATRVR